MEPKADLKEAVDNPRSRRALLAGVVGGLGAWLASTVQRAMPAEAAVGDPIRIGQTNNGGGSSTELRANTPKPTFRAIQFGDGDGLRGVATTGKGVVGIAEAPGGTGVFARGQDGRGVWAQSYGEGEAIYARATGRGSTALVADAFGAGRPPYRRMAIRAIGPSSFGGPVEMGSLIVNSPGHTPGVPPEGHASLFVRGVDLTDKLQLCVRFPTGLVQVLATEP